MVARVNFEPLEAAKFSSSIPRTPSAQTVCRRHDRVFCHAAESGKRILFEGPRERCLDVDHGTYPFVTSSNSSGVGVSNGSGVPARYRTR